MDIQNFRKAVFAIAIPVALQSMLQSSFSMIDQVMVGQLGKKAIAGVEIAGKPAFIYAFIVNAICTIAGIMIAQYIGQKDHLSEEKAITVNGLVTIVFGFLFTAISLGFTRPFLHLFTKDEQVIREGMKYLRIIGYSYIPLGLTSLLAVPIRTHGKSSWPLYVSILSAIINTSLNYVLIFGHFGMPQLGITGAAIASVISQLVSMILLTFLFLKLYGGFHPSLALGKKRTKQYIKMLAPVVLSEFLWTLGQSMNTFVYGHMGTSELAGMSLTGPVQGMLIGALSGLSQAAGILIGQSLGEKHYEEAYHHSKTLMRYGFIGSAVLAVALLIFRTPYVGIYQVDHHVQSIGSSLLLVFAFLMPIKVENMILGGGIIRSGGLTHYIMFIDTFGTWGVGVPLALLSGLVFHLPIVSVYLILSQEEVVRLIISIIIFRSKKWMHTIN